MKPLEGIKVVELSTMLAGPMTARLLAEWGADVIKVESMNGDPWRKQYGTSLSPYTEHANPNFDMQNINKRFVAFNMRTPEGKEAMMKLLATADVFLTNYRIQALEQMGLIRREVERRLIGIAQGLADGKIGAEPVEGLSNYRPCDWCDYHAVCGHEDSDAVRRLAELDRAEAMKRMEEGMGDG